MSGNSDFVIENGVLVKYNGSSGDVTVPEGVRVLSHRVFAGRKNLTSVRLPEGVETVGSSVFQNCTSLQKVELPASVTAIDGWAFDGCSALREICLPAALIYVGDNAFSGCTSLEQIEIPSLITSLSSNIFRDCTCLQSIHFADTITYIGDGAFYNCRNLSEITLPDSLKVMGKEAFRSCSSLTELTIPVGVTELPEACFAGCSALVKLTLPEGLEIIGSSALGGCAALAELDIPEQVYKLSTYAFCDIWHGCDSLRRLTIRGTQVRFGKDAFFKLGPEVEIILTQMSPAKLPEPQRSAAVRTFARQIAAGEELTARHREIYLKYIKKSLKGLCDIVLQTPELLRLMLQEKMISSTDLDGLLTRVAGKPELTAMLLDYQQTQFKFTPAQRQIKQERELQTQMDLLLSNVLDPDQAKKLWQYEKTLTGGIRLLGYKGDETEILVPAFVGNDPVTAIGPDAFSPDAKPLKAEQRELRAKKITSVVLPDSVTEIGDSAFHSCAALTSVHLPAQTGQLPQGLFAKCGALQQVTVGESSSLYADVDGMLFSADKTELLFCPAGKKGAYSIPKSVKSVLNGAAPAASGESAFSGCAKLKSVTVPSEVTQLPVLPFEGCKALTAIEVDEDNPAYHSADGVLFNRNMTRLIQCPPAKEGAYTVPEAVKEIAADAFSKCSKLTEIYLPDTLEEIGSSAFLGCRKIETITIPNGVRCLKRSVFSTCQKLTDVFLSAQLVEIDSFAFYGCSKDLTIHAPAGSYAEQYAQEHNIPFQAL